MLGSAAEDATAPAPAVAACQTIARCMGARNLSLGRRRLAGGVVFYENNRTGQIGRRMADHVSGRNRVVRLFAFVACVGGRLPHSSGTGGIVGNDVFSRLYVERSAIRMSF